jgi:serine/threonine-protein kinase
MSRFAIGSLVKARGREWVVLPESQEDLVMLRPLAGVAEEVTGIVPDLETIEPAVFALPDPAHTGDHRSCSLLRDAVRLGQYVLVERLGAGGMGEVHRAEHRLLRRPCAIKLIRPEHAGNADVLRRFEREVQATATLTHPNTIAIYDYGISDDGTFYYVMEYLPGDTLEQLVARDGPMDASRAIHVLRQIAGALHEAHGAGLTHRDIKPGNVMLGERGGVGDVAKLLDFGLVTARQTTGDAGDGAISGITQMGTILGTPAYMSPEQCAGDQQPGPASDLYSLGALGYFLVTGRSPFEGRAPLQMMLAHLSEAPPSARLLRPELPSAFDALLQRSLAKRPEDRFASAQAMEQALRGLVV